MKDEIDQLENLNNKFGELDKLKVEFAELKISSMS